MKALKSNSISVGERVLASTFIGVKGYCFIDLFAWWEVRVLVFSEFLFLFIGQITAILAKCTFSVLRII